jgi:hypothetical protein
MFFSGPLFRLRVTRFFSPRTAKQRACLTDRAALPAAGKTEAVQ